MLLMMRMNGMIVRRRENHCSFGFWESIFSLQNIPRRSDYDSQRVISEEIKS